MSEQQSHNVPFQTLGTHLKYLREQLRESLAEVSGAVEIDIEALERIERGVERPSEDILLLLIAHYNMQDQEAVQLWEMAGYDGDYSEKYGVQDDSHHTAKPVVMLLAMDMRTVYTDGLQITANASGMTLNFTQTGSQGQALPVARLGMSYNQACEVLKDLQRALLQVRYMNGPAALPPSIDNKNDQPKS